MKLKTVSLETLKYYQHESAYNPHNSAASNKSAVIVMMGAGNIVNLTPSLLK